MFTFDPLQRERELKNQYLEDDETDTIQPDAFSVAYLEIRKMRKEFFGDVKMVAKVSEV